MAGNKFATILHKNCHKIIVILVYAVLEWILILFLLFNSLFSYMIAKFAKYFGLKPICTWCSTLDQVFSSQNVTKTPHFDHVCEAHAAEISNKSYCSTHKKLANSNNLCIHCSSSTPPDCVRTDNVSSTVAFFTWMSGNASEGGDGGRCSCCDQVMTSKVYPQSLIFNPTWDALLDYINKNKVDVEAYLMKKETELEGNGRDDVDDDNQRELLRDNDGGKKSDSNVEEVQEWRSSDDPFLNQGCNEEEDEESVFVADMLLQNTESMDSDRFICIELIDANTSEEEIQQETINECSTMEAQEKALNALYTELEEERKAAAEAAKETMALITKLQEEKAAIQMEALQYQRMMEEQAEYDQEALQLLNDLMLRRDKEKKEVEKELHIYRAKVFDYEARENMASRKGSLVRTPSNASSNDTHSIDLHCEDEYDERNLDEEMAERGLELIANSMMPDISLAEFDEERVSILGELKVLEGKLLALQMHDDEENTMPKKLLPLFDGEDNEFDCDKSNQSAAGMLLQEEFGHVYERLQALEEDKDFLKHCIRSMVKGNQGMALVQEILQHLRDLKSAQLHATNSAHNGIPLSDASMPNEDHQL